MDSSVIDRDMISGLTGTGTGTDNFYLTGTGTNNPILPGPGWPGYDRDMTGMTGNPGKNPGKLEWLTGTGTKNPELTGTGTGIKNQHLTGTGTGIKNVTWPGPGELKIANPGTGIPGTGNPGRLLN